MELPATGAGPGDRYARAALAQELARVAAAPVGQRNRQLWESTRNLYNLVATGALDHHEVDQALLAAAERCGLLAEEPRQTHRTLASGRQVGLAHPGRPRQPTSPERTHALADRYRRLASEPRRGGEGHGRRRPPGRLTVSRGWARAAAKQSPRPPRPPAGRNPAMGSHPTLAHHQLATEALETAPRPPGSTTTATGPADHPRPASRPSTGSTPTSASPPTAPTPIGHQATRPSARPPSPSAPGSPSTTSRENDRNPVIWQAGQDYRAADAIRAARRQPTRTRRGPERLGPER